MSFRISVNVWEQKKEQDPQSREQNGSCELTVTPGEVFQDFKDRQKVPLWAGYIRRVGWVSSLLQRCSQLNGKEE